MTTTMIPDAELIEQADVVTLWIATPEAPTDFWSLSEAVAWVMRQPRRDAITLFRPPDRRIRAAWVGPDQIERLALLLVSEASAA